MLYSDASYACKCGGVLPTAKITLPANHPEYKAYKVFNVEYNDDAAQTTSPYVYTIKNDSLWFTELFEESDKTATPKGGQTSFTAEYLRNDAGHNVYTIKKGAANERVTANLLLGKVDGKTSITIHANASGETVDLDGPGYYLITTGTTPAVVAVGTTNNPIDVSTKMTTTPTIKKEITKVAGEVYSKSDKTTAPACVGDKIEFTITVNIPSGFSGNATDKIIEVYDVAQEGLEIDAQTIIVSGETVTGTPTVINSAGQSFNYTIPVGQDNVDVVIKYTATLKGTEANVYTNTAYLTYDEIKSVEAVNTITTNNVEPGGGGDGNDDRDPNAGGPFTLTKFDGNSIDTQGPLLKGAKFKVYRKLTGGYPIKFNSDVSKGYQVAPDQSATGGVTDTIDLSSDTATATIKGLGGTVWFENVDSVQVVNTVTTNNVKPNEPGGDTDPDNLANGPFTITKYAKGGNLLKGAQFKVYRSQTSGTPIKFSKEGNNYTAYTNQNASLGGAIVDTIDLTATETAKLIGLGGTVWFEEVKAPAGYNMLTERKSVQVDIAFNNNGRNYTGASTWTDGVDGGFAVENNAGALLPSTGGIGTTIFYVVGAILLLGAVVMLVVRRRMDK